MLAPDVPEMQRAGPHVPLGLAVALAAAAALAAGQWRGRTSGSTRAERRRRLPGDGDGGTRLQLRVRGRTRPWWLTAAYVAALVPADHVMAGGTLAGIGRRAAPVSGGGSGGRPGS